MADPLLPMRSVVPLPRVAQLQALVAEWLLSEWPGWYGPGGAGDLAADVEAFARSETVLPVGFVAFDAGAPVGFGALKAESIASHRHLSPWAAAGFVVPARRGQRIGSALLQAIDRHARSLGYACVHCGTSTAGSLLVRSGWQRIERITHAGRPLDIFRSVGEPALP